MDHSNAHLMEYTSDSIETKTLESKFTHQEKEETLVKSEKTMHNNEQHEDAEYYKKLGETIKDYDEVILFGPTSAKMELYNILKSDHRFAKIKIETKQTDKMTESQLHSFVKDYFSGN
jgi:ADP-heptose:LPS heptosyltransferase